MKKLLFILSIFCANFALAHPIDSTELNIPIDLSKLKPITRYSDGVNTWEFKEVGEVPVSLNTEFTAAPQYGVMYSFLLQSPSYVEACRVRFTEHCMSVLNSISSITTNQQEIAQRKFATAILSKNDKEVLRAVTICTTNTVFSDISDVNTVLDLVYNHFANNYTVISNSN